MKQSSQGKPLLMRTALGIYTMSIMFIVQSCATYDLQQADIARPSSGSLPEVSHTFYLAGGYGDLAESATETNVRLRQELESAPPNSTVIFTGDNISPDLENWPIDSVLIDRQLKLTEGFKGDVYFLPGNNEWKSFNADKIERVEDLIKDRDLENTEVEPNNVCPIEHRVINDELDLILVDSRWFISNWSRVEGINEKCTDILTRRRFIEELEGYINDGQGKNIVIAMHHPVFSNGRFAGKETLKQHLTPLPILGSLIYGFKHLGAFSPELLMSMRYRFLRILVTALAQASDRITVVSGHEQSLQYLRGGDVHQVISGSLNAATATERTVGRVSTVGGSLEYEGIYTHGTKGFAKLTYYEDGSSQVTFYPADGSANELMVLAPFKEEYVPETFKQPQSGTVEDAVLDNTQSLEKSGFYRFLWGERYRKYFGTKVTAPVALLDTLYGGLTVTKKGGGHQSYSIRLEDDNRKEYAMRSLRKNALKFLKFKIPGIAYTDEDYEGTWAEEVISDFFTTAHPYMQLVVNPLAKAVNVNHSSPSLFYIPKQERLGPLNEQFGDELYFIEERPSDEQMNFKGYRRSLDTEGEIKEFESTTDMLEKIKSDEEYVVDQQDFIRARLFDMLIGDWDRHQDQWRWVEYEVNDEKRIFQPVPRDRDNVFPRFDGFAMDLVQWFVPNARRFQSYGPEIENLKALNQSGNNLDRVLTTQFGEETWVGEARYIQEKLDEKQVREAFSRLPVEVQDEVTEQLQKDLLIRLEKLPEIARQYSAYLDKQVVLHGTEKDDVFEISRLPGGKTRVVISRLLEDEKNIVMFDRTFDSERTKELYLYGLGDDDVFKVTGEDRAEIKIRIIGGYGKDHFQMETDEKIKVYDWPHEEISFSGEDPGVHFTNLYKTNTFHWRYFEEDNNILVPNLGFRTDDGLFFGLRNTVIDNGFNGNPFRRKHSVFANYFQKFEAVELGYDGIFANIMPAWNFELSGYFTSNRYAENFFGFGNDSQNLEETLGRDYYRARLQQVRATAGIAYHTLRFRGVYESFKLQEVQDRLFTMDNFAPELFESQHYLGVETTVAYWNEDAPAFPTRSLYVGLDAGYKFNPDISDNQFGYFAFTLGAGHKLIPSGNLVLATRAQYRTNFGDNYFFYHAPSLGGNNGLRGFRDERFSGESYFYQTSDLRVRLKRIVTAVTPITIGVYGGFDYGRVWVDNEDSTTWHTSQGGGLWISALNFWAFKAGIFNSDEDTLIQVGLGVDF